MGKFKKVIIALQVILIVLFIIVNGRSLYRRISWNLDDGFQNQSTGKKFTSGKWIYADIIERVKDEIHPYSKVYYFNFVDDGKENLSAESFAMVLNYYLHPVTVHYRNISYMKDSDFIICQRGVFPVLQYDYRDEIKNIFRIIERGDNYIILKRVKESKDK